VLRSVLQCFAVCSNAVQCVGVCCSVLQCVAVCHNVLQSVAVCCSVLQCETHLDVRISSTMPLMQVHCNKLRHTTTHCSTLQHTVTHCNTLQHTTTYSNAHDAPPAPMNHVNIFKGWSPRNAPLKMVQLWYKLFPSDQRGQVEMTKSTRLSNKTSAA